MVICIVQSTVVLMLFFTCRKNTRSKKKHSIAMRQFRCRFRSIELSNNAQNHLKLCKHCTANIEASSPKNIYSLLFPLIHVHCSVLHFHEFIRICFHWTYNIRVGCDCMCVCIGTAYLSTNSQVQAKVVCHASKPIYAIQTHRARCTWWKCFTFCCWFYCYNKQASFLHNMSFDFWEISILGDFKQ